MYIKFSKKLDLIRKRNEYDLKYAARQTLYTSQFKRYREAERIWADIIKSKLNDIFAEEFKSLQHLTINIILDNRYNVENAIVQNIRIAIIYNEADNAYSPKWRYDIALDMDYLNDNVVRLSTPATYWDRIDFANIANADVLLNSAKLIRKFADFDWQTFVTDAMKDSPKIKNYISVLDPEYDSNYRNPNYGPQILEAQIEEIVGTDKWLAVSGPEKKAYIKVIDIDDTNIQYRHISANCLTSRTLNEELDFSPNKEPLNRFFQTYSLLEPIEVINEEDLKDIASSYDS